MAGVRRAGVLHLYVDSALKATAQEAAPTDVSNEAELNLGSLSLGTRQFFDGLLDEVRVYNIALTAEEIRAIFEQEAQGLPRE